MENPIKMDDLEEKPLFLETPIDYDYEWLLQHNPWKPLHLDINLVRKRKIIDLRSVFGRQAKGENPRVWNMHVICIYIIYIYMYFIYVSLL